MRRSDVKAIPGPNGYATLLMLTSGSGNGASWGDGGRSIAKFVGFVCCGSRAGGHIVQRGELQQR